MEWGTLWGHFCGVAKMKSMAQKKIAIVIYIWKLKFFLYSWPPIRTYHEFGDLEISLFEI
jgi:hypothetical protein